MWTFYACGLDPKSFAVTEAALVQNTYPEPQAYPKMIWATNYTRLVCQVMFTLFFGGRDFAPKAILDGKNIQDYLQDHYIAACGHLAKRIHEAGDLEYDPIVGWESLNEPNRGLISYQDITMIPKEQQLKKGTTPTAWQAILTGSGRACEIETWDFGGMGPYKSGSVLIDPQGKSAWLPADHDDTKYGWKRDPGWRLGECLWAQHGIWDPATDTVLKRDHFGKDPKNGATVDYEYFTNHYWLPHYRAYSKMVKAVFPDSLMFFQPPVLEIPPKVKGTEDDDPNMIFSPHFYDGITLLTKKWYMECRLRLDCVLTMMQEPCMEHRRLWCTTRKVPDTSLRHQDRRERNSELLRTPAQSNSRRRHRIYRRPPMHLHRDRHPIRHGRQVRIQDRKLQQSDRRLRRQPFRTRRVSSKWLRTLDICSNSTLTYPTPFNIQLIIGRTTTTGATTGTAKTSPSSPSTTKPYHPAPSPSQTPAPLSTAPRRPSQLHNHPTRSTTSSKSHNSPA